MPNFLFVYRGGHPPETPEAGEADMKAWMDWMGEHAQNCADAGNPVAKSYSVRQNGSEEGAPEPTMGYTIYTAPDLETALKVAQASPHMNSGGFVEVAEIVPVEM